MHVLFINQYYWPDVAATAQILTDLAEFLAGRGHEVTVVCSRQPYTGDGGSLPPGQVRNGVRIVRVPATGGGRRTGSVRRAADCLSFFLGAGVEAFLLARPGTIVVTLTSPPMIGLLGRAIQLLRRAHHLHWCMDMCPDLLIANGFIEAGGWAHRVLSFAARGYVSACDAVCVLGPYMKERIQTYNPPRGRLYIMPVWADGKRLAPIPRKQNRFIDRCGLTGKFVVLYSGNIGTGESLDTILDAAERLAEDDGIVFVFIAEGPQRDRLEATARARGLANVRFLPYEDRRDLAYSLSSGHVHVVYFGPGRDGMKVPCKTYGIMAVGGPILYVGSAGNEVADLVSTNRIGFVVRDGDAPGVVAAIKTLRSDPGLLREMSYRSRTVFEREYDFEIVAGRFNTLLHTLFSQRKWPPRRKAFS
ncbi:MAG TPA: glycosyltransferase family 4 protein [Phycisphaerae bacterium]|nr:glycosyltransferase family 4 protein [Phycisphaerae bacterium]HUU90209.1 glycosyltransferase family 4 protein [Phycisphaerae bacterium]